MKKRIFICIVLSPLCVLLLCTAAGIFIFGNAFSAQIGSVLEAAAAPMSEHIDSTCGTRFDAGVYAAVEHAAQRLPDGLHAAVAAPDGASVFDSAHGELPEGDYSFGSEAASSMLEGNGYAETVPPGAGYKVCNYAVRLESGAVLCVYGRSSELRGPYIKAAIIIAAVCAGTLLLAVCASILLTKRLIHPMNELVKHIDENDIKAPYDELVPLVEYVKHSRDSAQEVEKLRREFTANVSHELKTPLTSISGYAEMIETGIARKEDVPTFARKIHFEASRLLTLIADIIQLSELDSLTGQDDREDVDLLEIASNAESYLSMSAEQNGVEIEVCGEPLIVNGCRSQLEELVYNLCDNAIRYNRVGGSVKLTVTETDGFPSVSVKDTGIGIPDDKKERIFERFYRVDKSRSKKSGGTGLGLAIVKHIAMRHGAEIRVESRLGEGTEISVIFRDLPAATQPIRCP